MKRIISFTVFILLLIVITGINSSAQEKGGSSIVIIDRDLRDFEIFRKEITPGSKVAHLDNSKNPLVSILKILRENAPVRSLHILSQGKPGTLVFSYGDVNINNLERDEAIVGAWKEYFTKHGDILLYGCEIAKGQEGINFVRSLAVLTGLDIAASDNLTGSVFKGGDWFFEVHSGRIETKLIVSKQITEQYGEVLRRSARKGKTLL
jgi:hypothetical protein